MQYDSFINGHIVEKNGSLYAAPLLDITGIYNAGFKDGQKDCAAKHYTAVVYGDGTETLTFQLPLEPDYISVVTNAPEIRLMEKVVAYVELDFAALGQFGGKYGVATTATGTDSIPNFVFPPSAIPKIYKRESGETELTLSVISQGQSYAGSVFGNGMEYLVTASKFDLPPLKTRIEESVARLPDQTTTKPVYYQQAKVNAAFTDEEWEALKATKPNYTFNVGGAWDL